MTEIHVLSQTQVIDVDPEAQEITVNPSTGVAVVVGSPANAVSITHAGPVGPPGIQGPPGDAELIGYNHIQSSASDVWTINHNLGYKPSVQVFTVGGLEVIGEIQHISSNQVTVTFNTPLAGTARLT